MPDAQLGLHMCDFSGVFKHLRPYCRCLSIFLTLLFEHLSYFCHICRKINVSEEPKVDANFFFDILLTYLQYRGAHISSKAQGSRPSSASEQRKEAKLVFESERKENVDCEFRNLKIEFETIAGKVNFVGTFVIYTMHLLIQVSNIVLVLKYLLIELDI